MLLTPRVREGIHGAHVVTPLVRENGTTILVDRGFVSNDYASDMSFSKEEGEVEILGMLRTSQTRNNFTPDNLPEDRIWYWNDVESMAAYAGGEDANVQPVFVEKIFRAYSCGSSILLSTILHRWACGGRGLLHFKRNSGRTCGHSRYAQCTPIICDNMASLVVPFCTRQRSNFFSKVRSFRSHQLHVCASADQQK